MAPTTPPSTADFGIYSFLIAYWITQFPGGFFPLADGELATDVDDRAMWRQFPIQFVAALDLALWPPFGPKGFCGEGPPAWSDLSPGWRFSRVCDLIREDGGLDRLPPEGGEERFDELQGIWCERLNWPTPNRLAKMWMDCLSSLDEYPFVRMCDMSQTTFGRWRRTALLLQSRLDDPLGSALNVLRESQTEAFTGVASVCPRSDDDRALCFRLPATRDNASEASAMTYLQHKLVRAFFTGSTAGLSIDDHQPLVAGLEAWLSSMGARHPREIVELLL